MKKIKIKNSETFQNLKKTWYYAKNQKKNLTLYFISSLLLSLIGAIIPVLAAQQILKLSNNLLGELFYVSLIILGTEILRNAFSFVSMKTAQIFFRETLLFLQSDMAKMMLKFETNVIDKNASGIFIDRITKDTGDIADIFNNINYSLTDTITNIGVLIAIFVINKYMFIFFIVALLILFWFKKRRMKFWFEMDTERRKLSEKNTSLISELIRGLRDVKVLHVGENISKRMYNRLLESNQKNYEMQKLNRKYVFFTGSVQDVFDFIFIVLGIYLVSKGILLIPGFVILFMYKDKIFWLLDYISQFIETLKRFNVSAKRVFELLDDSLYPREKFGSTHFDKIEGNFEFRNVVFEYKENMPVLKNINFKINPNETVAFIGKSGSGKSTIFSLITKLYHPKSGEILIENTNINELDEESIRGNITVITQSPYIFNFSIKENLKIVDDTLTDEQIYEACKLACLHDFIMGLPEKYETLVGEGGVMLSGGERQRLAIARALLKKSEIILFDEATSALDNQTQKNIQDAINNMKGTYTILIIAHRLSTVINSDRILLIDDGQIVAEGTHKELYANNELYKNLYEKELTEFDTN